MDINKKCVSFNNTRDVFITQTNIYDEAFLRKYLKALAVDFFLQKESIINFEE